MTPSDQIAAINRKRADEHRRVDLVHDQLIEQVRGRCVHECSLWDYFKSQFLITKIPCRRCGSMLHPVDFN